MSRATVIRLALLAFIWGCSFLFIKVALEGLQPTQVVIGRVVAGAAALAIVVAIRGQRLPRDARLWAHMGVFAMIGNLVPFLLFAWGEQHVSSSRAGVLNATTPLWTLAVALLFLPEERPTTARFAGLVIGFAGVIVVLAPWSSHGSDGIAGQVACLGAAALYGLSFVYARRFVNRPGGAIDPGVLAATQLLAATAILVVISPWTAFHPVHITLRVALSIITLGALGTGIAYLIYHALMRDAGAMTSSLVTYLVPITAVVLGVVALHESLTWNVFAGAAVVIAGVAVAEGRLGQRRARRAVMFNRG